MNDEDLRYDLTITLEEAALGKEMDLKFPIMENCQECGGKGCINCNGTGKISVEKNLKINIPKGIDSGNRLRIHNFNDGGDLYIYIHIQPHPIFLREGLDIYYELPISATQAALGAEIEVPTIDGKIKLKIPKDIQSGTVLKIAGKGMPRLRGRGRGDELIKINVLTE